MEKQIYEVTYAEYMKLLSNKERELVIILQAHGIPCPSAHEIMSLNAILKKFYDNQVIELNEIIDQLDKCQTISNDKLKLLRM